MAGSPVVASQGISTDFGNELRGCSARGGFRVRVRRYDRRMPGELHGIDQESSIRIERKSRMSAEEFFSFCAANPDWQIEQTADGEIIIMPPAGGDSSYSSLEAAAQLRQWAEVDGRG